MKILTEVFDKEKKNIAELFDLNQLFVFLL